MQQVFGWVATSLSLIYKLPQIYVLCKHQRHEGLSLASLACQASAYGFYIAHGTLNDDWAIACMGSVSLLQSLTLIALYFHYKQPSIPSSSTSPTS